MAKAASEAMLQVQPHYDVVIVGAGISGIDIAYYLQTFSPSKSYTILEARNALGGTWDLFRYPGIRSDSDLYTFGYSWRPWTCPEAIADGASILSYLTECATHFGIDKKIQYQHKVRSANWSSPTQSWSLVVNTANGEKTIICRWVVFATGYYDYDQPLAAKIPGIENFKGKVIHPQFWPSEFDYSNKDIVIIGSGATAVTLLPKLAEKADKVTMLQRSPAYIVSQPEKDAFAELLRRYLPGSLASKLIRLKWVLLPFLFFKFCQRHPEAARRLVQAGAIKQLPPNIPVDPHFNPTYSPWEQRLCVCPAGDFYNALREGKAGVVTGHIKQITEDSIIMEENDQVLRPDVIVTATGLKLQISGRVQLSVNGEPVQLNRKYLWKGCMIEDVPNVALVLGYTNASWTLGADATANLIIRILKRMDSAKHTSVTPKVEGKLEDRPIMNLSSTYIVSAQSYLPRAGDKGPWKARESFLSDCWGAWYGSIKSGLHYQ